MAVVAACYHSVPVVRLSESVTEKDCTLWQAVFEYLEQQGSATRQQIFKRFSYDDELDLRAVLKDLLDSGFLYCTGQGDGMVYGPTSAEARNTLLAYDRLESAINRVWLLVHDQPEVTETEIVEQLKIDVKLVQVAIGDLLADGRIVCDEGSGEKRLSVSKLAIPVGSKLGWEVAVIDHFRAVTMAIAKKLHKGQLHSSSADTLGGTTLGFVVHPDHPFQSEVFGLLRRVREEVNQLWDKVSTYNEQHTDGRKDKVKVWFYFGQTIQEIDTTSSDNEETNQ